MTSRPIREPSRFVRKYTLRMKIYEQLLLLLHDRAACPHKPFSHMSITTYSQHVPSSDNLGLSAISHLERGKGIFASCWPSRRCSGLRSALGACRPAPWRGDAVDWHVLSGDKGKLPRWCPW